MSVGAGRLRLHQDIPWARGRMSDGVKYCAGLEQVHDAISQPGQHKADLIKPAVASSRALRRARP